MHNVLGGVAEWLHENGVETDININDRLHSFLGIYCINNQPNKICWLDGSVLVVNEARMMYELGKDKPMLLPPARSDNASKFDLSDPESLVTLLSTVR